MVKIIELMQLQLQQQREEMQQQREEMQQQREVRQAQEQRFRAQAEAQEQRFREQAERQKADIKAMHQLLVKPPQSGQVFPPATASATPTFSPFDSISELWKDYWSRFLTFTRAHAVPDDRKAQVFLANQSSTVYKLLSNLAAQETPPREINDLMMEQIVAYMKVQIDPTRFVIRERFKFWTTMQRRPGESIQELAARIRQAAATYDFASIADPLDEALRTRFICSVNNEAVLKALFKMKADDLDFTTAIQIAIQTEGAAKVAKETVYGPKSVPALAIAQKPSRQKPVLLRPPKKEVSVGQQRCYDCGNSDHIATLCKFKDAKCKICKLTGHLEAVCRKKARSQAQAQGVKWINVLGMVKAAPCRNSEVQKLQVPIHINGKAFTLELDTATGGNFISTRVWTELDKPKLQQAQWRYHSASKHPLPVIGAFTAEAKYGDVSKSYPVSFLVSEIPDLNLLGRDAITAMRISLDDLLFSETTFHKTDYRLLAIPQSDRVDRHLQQACHELCTEFSKLFKPELECLRGVQLKVEFRPDARPICKPRSVPFAGKN